MWHSLLLGVHLPGFKRKTLGVSVFFFKSILCSGDYETFTGPNHSSLCTERGGGWQLDVAMEFCWYYGDEGTISLMSDLSSMPEARSPLFHHYHLCVLKFV